MSDIIIRPLRITDIEGAIKLSQSEGWNQTEKDWRFFLENPESICLAAEQDGKLIATTTSIIYSGKLAWIAMVLVDKDYRGRGVSKTLLHSILDTLRSCDSIKLDATPAGQHVYKKFDFYDEYLIARMTALKANNLLNGITDTFIQRVQLAEVQEVISLDEAVFGVNRRGLIEYLANEYPDHGWMLKRKGRVSGVALGRKGNKYHHVGPVLAENADDAKMLIAKALDGLRQHPVVVDVLCDKEDLMHWLTTLGFVQQRTFIRMYNQNNPLPGQVAKQFLICGPEFG